MIGNRRDEGRTCTVLLHVFRKSVNPYKKKMTAILDQNSLSPFQDSNLDFFDRMPLRYSRLRRHRHCLNIRGVSNYPFEVNLFFF